RACTAGGTRPATRRRTSSTDARISSLVGAGGSSGTGTGSGSPRSLRPSSDHHDTPISPSGRSALRAAGAAEAEPVDVQLAALELGRCRAARALEVVGRLGGLGLEDTDRLRH